MSVQHYIALDNTTTEEHVPNLSQFTRWCHAALTEYDHSVEISIRIVDAKEMAQLNQTYRNKQGTTNILAFAFGEMPTIHTDNMFLGDLVICAPVVTEEAIAQDKAIADHWAHLTIHGTLHLCGYDHQTPEQASTMEALEIAILANLAIANPYEARDNG